MWEPVKDLLTKPYAGWRPKRVWAGGAACAAVHGGQIDYVTMGEWRCSSGARFVGSVRNEPFSETLTGLWRIFMRGAWQCTGPLGDEAFSGVHRLQGEMR